MADCSKCGLVNATIHLTQIHFGVMKSVDFCETCFQQSEFHSMIQKQSTANEIGGVESLRQKLQAASTLKATKPGSPEPPFLPEAHAFVRNALDYAFRKSAQSKSHLTARELIQACKEYATENWGAGAKALLQSWGIKSASDVGQIVFLLVEAGVLDKRPEDTLTDFHNLPFMD